LQWSRYDTNILGGAVGQEAVAKSNVDASVSHFCKEKYALSKKQNETDIINR